MLTSCSPSRVLLENVHEKKSSHLLYFQLHSFFNCIHLSPHCSSFSSECFFKKNLPCMLSAANRKPRACVCLLRGSDIFALQEVQLQHHQILQMLDWVGLVSPVFLFNQSLSRRARNLQIYQISQSQSKY